MPHSARALVALAVVVASASATPAQATAVSSAPNATPSQAEAGSREAFVVEPFRNTSDVETLDYLRTGLPAFVAERLGRLRPLRFVGPPNLLGPAAASAQWRVRGELSRTRGDRIAVTVLVAGASDDEPSVRISRTGTRAEMPQLALAATVEAFTQLLGPRAPVLDRAATAPFARDPYAFVLYARGIAAHAGLRRRDNGPKAALAWLSRALRVDPRSPEILRYLAAVEKTAGKLDRARSLLLGALEARPEYATALADLARVEREAKHPAARERYARLVDLDPDDVDARRTFGELLADAGDYDRAEQQLDRVLDRLPDDLAARRTLAVVLAAERGAEAQIANLEAIVRLDDGSLSAHLDLAAAYAGAGRLADAEAAYDEVLRRKPRQPAVLKLAGDLALARRDFGKARACFARLRSLSPTDPRPVFRLGSVAFASGDLKSAERWFGEAVVYPGMVGAAYGNLGAVALARGDTKEALWLLGRAVKHRPRLASARYNLARALLDAGRVDEAMDEARTAVELAWDDADTYFLAGVVALRLDRLIEAEQDFQRAVRLDAHHAQAAHNLARVERLLEDKRGAAILSRQVGSPTSR